MLNLFIPINWYWINKSVKRIVLAQVIIEKQNIKTFSLELEVSENPIEIYVQILYLSWNAKERI